MQSLLQTSPNGKIQAEIPYAVNTQYDIVKSNSATNNFSETEAATPLTVKITYDFAIGVKNITDIAISKSDNAQYTTDIAKTDELCNEDNADLHFL